MRLVRGCMWSRSTRHLWGITPAGDRRCARCGLDWSERLLSRPLRVDSLYSGMDDRRTR